MEIERLGVKNSIMIGLGLLLGLIFWAPGNKVGTLNSSMVRNSARIIPWEVILPFRWPADCWEGLVEFRDQKEILVSIKVQMEAGQEVTFPEELTIWASRIDGSIRLFCLDQETVERELTLGLGQGKKLKDFLPNLDSIGFVGWDGGIVEGQVQLRVIQKEMDEDAWEVAVYRWPGGESFRFESIPQGVCRWEGAADEVVISIAGEDGQFGSPYRRYALEELCRDPDAENEADGITEEGK